MVLLYIIPINSLLCSLLPGCFCSDFVFSTSPPLLLLVYLLLEINYMSVLVFQRNFGV